LAFETKALAEWQALDGSVKEPLRKLLKKRLIEPRTPGAELHGDLRDCYKIKLRKHGYRLIYRVTDNTLMVLVLALDKRDGDAVYASALKRLRAG
jgi:mRNA interferase RelE/StbE